MSGAPRAVLFLAAIVCAASSLTPLLVAYSLSSATDTLQRVTALPLHIMRHRHLVDSVHRMATIAFVATLSPLSRAVSRHFWRCSFECIGACNFKFASF